MPERTGPEQEQGGRDASTGRFRPGASGNPAGRPRGSRNRITVLADELLDGAAEDIVEKLIVLARAGDRMALRLVIDRVVPARRDRRVELGDMRRVQTAGDLVEVCGQVIQLAAAGEISLEEAREFMRLLEQQRRAIDAADLQLRVEALEAELERERGRERY